MKKYKKTLIIAVISLMIMGIVPFTTTADTITKTQADTFVATGEMYWGMNREQVKAWTREMGKTPFYPSWDADWCAWFVTNAARTSEISSYVIPNLTNCDRTWYMNRGQYHTGRGWGSNYTPKRGDILYFDFDYDNYSDHTGIVRYVKNGRVYTVEGNYLHTVNGSSMSWTNDVIYRSYSLYNDYIRGYSTPRFGPIDNSYTIKYNANGGSGYMAPTKVPRYGTRVPLRSNKFTRPGYVFVETEQIEKFAEKMQDVKCFSKLLKAEDKILTVTEEEKHFLESIMDENYCVNYSQGFIVGENVVITEGVLRNKNALIRKVDRHRRIAMLDVNIFGRRTPVEVGFGAFAKVTDEQWEQIRQNNISRHEHVNKSTRDDNVKIITGVFHGMTGKLVSLNTANNECVVELQLFDADVNVSFGREEVEFL